MKLMCLTKRNRRVIHIYNDEFATKDCYDSPGSIHLSTCDNIISFHIKKALSNIDIAVCALH